MRADYATSDLVSKVNSDWINAVLVNREFDRAEDRDHMVADDLTLPSDPARQIIPLWPKPVPAAKSRAVEGITRDCAAFSTPLGRAPSHRTDGSGARGLGG